MDRSGTLLDGDDDRRGRHLSHVSLHGDLGPDNPQHQSYPSYYGDRILVSKFAYELADPQRWDVIVFKFPGDATTDARTNFIKRLVGLPGETVRIRARRRVDSPRPGAVPDRAEAAGEAVGHAPAGVRQRLHAADRGVWLAGALAARTARRRQHGRGVAGPTTMHVSRPTARPPARSWLRYHHLVPTYEQWKSRRYQREPAPVDLEPQLITDFTAYNTGRSRRGTPGATRHAGTR